jgi:hypothetical protein
MAPSPSSTLPDRGPQLPIEATRAPAMTIDGDASEWTLQHVSRAVEPITTGTTTVTADISLMWDNEALYLLATVVDDSVNATDPTNRVGIFRGDAVVLELGSDNTALDREAFARPTDGYYMFGPAPGLEGPQPTVPPDPRGTVIMGVLRPTTDGRSFDIPDNVNPQPTAAARRTAQGYVLEAKIPWTSTRLTGIGPNTKLAANIVVSDRKPNSYANRGMVSTNPQRTALLRAHPYYWQYLVLLP